MKIIPILIGTGLAYLIYKTVNKNSSGKTAQTERDLEKIARTKAIAFIEGDKNIKIEIK